MIENFLSVISTILLTLVFHEVGYYLSDIEYKKHLGRCNISHLIFGFMVVALLTAFIIIVYKILSLLN
tara:strand:- start:361 stop:564 length:204 start_codon:yes stop_codon:yes gene_type:complete